MARGGAGWEPPLGWGRMRRYGQFGTALVADRMRRKLGGGGRRATADDASIAFMGELKGLPQKLGQHLSLKDHASYSRYAPLLVRGVPAPDAAMLAQLERSLGRERRGWIAHIEQPCVASGSVAQSYRGRLAPALGGHAVAVKILYPKIAEVLQADVRAVQRLTELIVRFLPATAAMERSALERVLAGLEAAFLEETDCRGERRALEAFAGFCEERPWLVAPEPVEALCTESVLVTRWLDGVPWWEALKRAERKPQKDAVTRLARAYMAMAFQLGEVHADLHPGNFLACGPPSDPLSVIGFLDFGQVLRRPPRWWAAMRGLIEAARAREPSALAGHYLTLGFDPDALDALLPVLLPLTCALLRPFVVEGRYDLREWRLQEELDAVLLGGERRLSLDVPAELVMLQRVFYGLFFYIRHFNVQLDWYRLVVRASGERA